jgi:uracil-DNA glycosylase
MFNLNAINVDISWRPILQRCLAKMDPAYLDALQKNKDWFPGLQAIFNAFTLPLEKTRFILFGESPYPRAASANGFAFWDAAVTSLWSSTGLSKEVNRATSLRNFIKMLLLASGDLTPKTLTQPHIAAIDKSSFIQTIDELFQHLMEAGFLLLNANLVFDKHRPVLRENRYWQPFMSALLDEVPSTIQLILFGKVAEKINQFPAANHFTQLLAEHPYNLSFIQEPKVLNFFKPFNLLLKSDTL